MSLNDIYDFDFLKNEAEEIAKDALEKEMDKDKSICSCQDCVLDTIGFALNNVRPLYKTSLKGVVYTTSGINGKYVDAVEESVRHAIEKVKNNPSH